MSNYKYFCMFIGYPRSGHSLIGALLNAHKEILIAHEYDVVKHLGNGATFSQIEKGLINRNQWFQTRENTWSGYSYQIPNQFQNKKSGFDIIGDKKGGRTTHRFMEDNSLIDLTLTSIPLPIKWIHVCRNPFNIISTMTKYKDSLEFNADLFIKYHNTFQLLKSKLAPENLITIYLEDLLASPEKMIINLLEYINKEYNQQYLDDCISILYKKPNNSSKNHQWPKELINKLTSYLQTSEELKHYSIK